jgi:hypothetical protein
MQTTIPNVIAPSFTGLAEKHHTMALSHLAACMDARERGYNALADAAYECFAHHEREAWAATNSYRKWHAANTAAGKSNPRGGVS